MREGFREIVSGWTLIDGIEDLTDRIERAAAWTVANGPLEEDEQATVEIMIRAQVARGMLPSSITCPDCGMTSYHPEDVKHRYCANCHQFHDG